MKIALLISGGGTTMEAIIKACKNGSLLGVVPGLIISSTPSAGAIEKAKALGISPDDILILNPKSFSSQEEFGEVLIAECRKRNIDFIGQYGWLIKTPDIVCEAFKGRIVNQHPGPLDNGRPDFGGPGMYGMRVHQARLEFVRKTGHDFWTEATTHRVTSHFDKGRIVKRKQIPIFQNDTAETLQARLLPVEHEVQIEALRDFANNTVSEFTREHPLVLADELETLAECKENARKAYPNG
ncbi:MAG: formyltransferase family protein [Patescibacteria group bacterium]